MTAKKQQTVDVSGHAESLAAACPIVFVGDAWGPVPLWRAELAELQATVDVAAMDEDAARTQLPDIIQQMLNQRGQS